MDFIDRRTLLKSAGMAIAGVAGGTLPTFGCRPSVPGSAGKPGFIHRGYLGWITDLATLPDPTAAWPSMRLDRQLLEDYRESFRWMSRAGFNSMSVWGLYVSRSWPTDVESAVAQDRGEMVEQLIEAGHQNGIKIYSGLGVYSWGFDEIIRAHPELTRDNPNAMCASEPAAWEWMQRVIDYVFERFPVDGVSMQSADQGRCSCSKCSEYSDAEYHALLNVRCAEYIRGRWADKLVAVNSWGMRFEEPETLPSLVKMSRHLDYLIDVHDTSRKRDLGYRKQIIDSLECAFGTLGGPQVEPPQHWERDRWFLPTLRVAGEHLHQLGDEGGRACEYFFHILANPGDELSFWLAGKVLADPDTPWEKHLDEIVGELYGAPGNSSREALIRLLLDAEEAYFRHLPERLSGTISMEPLVSSEPGPPIYLTKRLNETQRREYRNDLLKIQGRIRQLLPEIPAEERMNRIVRCINRVIQDLEGAGS